MKLGQELSFRCQTRVDQIADSLRASLRGGVWKDCLPPERALSEIFNTSRPLIRKGLHRLRDEHWIRIVPGHPAVIRFRPPTGSPQPVPQRVILLFGESPDAVGQWPILVVDALRKKLYQQGRSFEFVVELRLKTSRSPKTILRQLVARHHASHWILAGMPAPVQRWFQEQGIPAVIMGNAYPDIHLPFVNDDLRAVARHAATRFLGLGHRRIVFLRRALGGAGEAAEEGGFLEAFLESSPPGRVVKHKGDVDAIRRRLGELFSGPDQPTGLLVSHAMDTLVVNTWFLEHRIRMPEEVSVISFQWESFLERVRPRPAWYRTDPVKHAAKLCRCLDHPNRDQIGPSLIFPQFFKNEALARPRRTSSLV